MNEARSEGRREPAAGSGIDPRQSDLIDLSVRLVSPLVVLWIRPFGSTEGGFWPSLVVAVAVSFLAAGVLWMFVDRHFEPLRGLMMSEPPSRFGVAIGAVAGLITMFLVASVLSLPAAHQKLRWDDGMLGLAIALLAAIYVAAGLAIWMSGRTIARPRERPRAADLADLIRRHADLEAIAWLAEEPEESARPVVLQLSHSSDPEVRKWVVTNATARLGPPIVEMLVRVASSDDREDVVDAAIDRLVEIAPDRAEAFWPSLRARLHSDDQMDVEVAAWKLLAAHDPDLRQELAAVAPRWADSPYMLDSFRVLAWCILRDRDEIAALIKSQDLNLLPWLVKAAFYLDDEEVWDAIAFAAERGTDHRAKRQYARALRYRYSSALPDVED